MKRVVQKAPASMVLRESDSVEVDLPLFQLSLSDELSSSQQQKKKVADLGGAKFADEGQGSQEEDDEFSQFEQSASMLQFSQQVTYVGPGGEGSSSATAAGGVIEIDEPGARSLFSSPASKTHNLSATTTTTTTTGGSASSLSPTAIPGAALAATDLFRRMSPKPVLIPESRNVFDFQPQPAAVAGAASNNSSSENDDLFQTSIPFPAFVSTVSSPAFDDRYEFEVELLQQMSSTSEEHAKLFLEATVNGKMMKKNRYSNVIPTRVGRVVLPSTSLDPSDSYINACLLPPQLPGCTHGSIAAQAPLPHTSRDFWLMVWSQNIQLVVMLTKEKEKDARGMFMIKAHAYWPEPNSQEQQGQAAPDDSDLLPSAEFGEFTVTLLSTHVEADIIIRELTLSHAGSPSEMRHIHHLQYTGWPDFGVPNQQSQASFLRIFTLYRAIRAHLHAAAGTGTAAVDDKEGQAKQSSGDCSGSSSATATSTTSSSSSASSSTSFSSLSTSHFPPTIVHCSAGIGRSGVWIAIDSILDYLAHQSSRNGLAQTHIDVFQLIRRMRESRQGMVQTKEQYRYIYQFVHMCIEKKLFGVGESSAASGAQPQQQTAEGQTA